MMRSLTLAAIGLFAAWPTSVIAAPPPAVSPALSAVTLAPALSAARPGDRALLAQHFAPLHRQAVDRHGANGLEGRADYITRIDFDGDWDARNDWENAARYPLPGAAYYSVVETTSHWFIVYEFFHPRDWADALFETEHENDSEGVLVAVRRDGSRFGSIQAAVTVAHSDFYSFVPARGAWSASAESLDGVLELDARDGRPQTTQEAGGHALKAWRRDAAFEGVLYYPSLVADLPPSAHDRTSTYVLIDLFEAGGVWERRNDPKLFASSGTFAGDRGGACGSGGILCTTNAAHAPWAWDDTNDGDVHPGEIATDPAKLVARYFAIPEAVQRAYTYNPYRSR